MQRKSSATIKNLHHKMVSFRDFMRRGKTRVRRPEVFASVYQNVSKNCGKPKCFFFSLVLLQLKNCPRTKEPDPNKDKDED